MAARLRVRIPVIDAEGDKVTGASVKFYEPGTASVAGVLTTGTPFAGNLYAAVTGGSPVSTTQTSDANGEVIIFTDTRSRFDVGIEIGGAAPVARVVAREEFILDPGDVMLSSSGDQSVIQTGTLAAPSLAQTGNLDTGFNVDSGGDPAVVRNGVGLLEATSATLVLRTPDGGEAATFDDAGTVTAPGLLRRYYVVNVEDEGMTYGTSTALAAGNKAAWAAMIAKYAALGHTVDFYVNDTLPMNGGINLHHGTGANFTFNIIGKPGRSGFQWHTAAGGGTPYLDLGNSVANQLSNCHIVDIAHNFTAIPTDAPTVRVGANCANLKIERAHFRDGGAGLASLYAIEDRVGFSLVNSKIVVRTDSAVLAAGGLFPAGVLCSATSGASGAHLSDVTIDGDDNVATSQSYGLRFTNTGLIDTPRLNGVHMKGHSICILKNTGAAGVVNLISNHLYLDSCAKGMFLDPPAAGGDVSKWTVGETWIAASTHGIQGSTGSGGTIGDMVFATGRITGTVSNPIGIAIDGAAGLIVTGFLIPTGINTAGESGIDIGPNGSRVLVYGNAVTVGASAHAAIRVRSGVTSCIVGPNVCIGGEQIVDGTLSNKRVQMDRAYGATV